MQKLFNSANIYFYFLLLAMTTHMMTARTVSKILLTWHMMPLSFENVGQLSQKKYLMPADHASSQKWYSTLVDMQELQSTSNMHSQFLEIANATHLPLTVVLPFQLPITSAYFRPLVTLYQVCAFKLRISHWFKWQQLVPFVSMWLTQTANHTLFYYGMCITRPISLQFCCQSKKFIRSTNLQRRFEVAMLNSIPLKTCGFPSASPSGANIYLMLLLLPLLPPTPTSPCCGIAVSCTLALPRCTAWPALFPFSASGMALPSATLVSRGVWAKCRLDQETSDTLTHLAGRPRAYLPLESALPQTYAVHFLKATRENVMPYVSMTLTPNTSVSTVYVTKPKRQF